MPVCGQANKNNVLALYMAVADYAWLPGGPFVGIDTICEKTGMSRSAVDRAIRDAKSLGVLRAHKGRGQAGTSYWELAATAPFPEDRRDLQVQLSRSEVLGGKPANLSKPVKAHTTSDVTPHVNMDVSGHTTSDAQVVVVKSSETESSEPLTSNDADAYATEEATPSPQEQSLTSPNETNEKTPLREVGVKWVSRVKWESLTVEERYVQRKLRAWSPASGSVDDRLAAAVAYLHDATREEIEHLLIDSDCGSDGEVGAVNAIRYMIAGAHKFPKLGDAGVKRVIDAVVIRPKESPDEVVVEEFRAAADDEFLRGLTRPSEASGSVGRISVPAPRTAPPEGPSEAYVGGPVDWWTGDPTGVAS
jgi:hypothetical protein